VDGQQAALEVEVASLHIRDPAAAKAVAQDQRRPDDVGRICLRSDDPLDH
jgi:hypothetical protein